MKNTITTFCGILFFLAQMGPKVKDQEVRGQVTTTFSEAPLHWFMVKIFWSWFNLNWCYSSFSVIFF